VILLAIDTATAQVGCALSGDDGPLASFQGAGGRRHAETLAPAIQFLCRQAGVGLHQLHAVAVDVGPGLFTGLRVGLATAKALAGALGVPMVGLTSLDVVAERARRESRVIAAVVDARRAEVYWSVYRRGRDGLERLTPYAVGPVADVVADLEARHEPCLAVGDGARRYAEALASVDGVEIGLPSEAYPAAATLAELAYPRARQGDVVTPAAVGALYLRSADTRVKWETRHPHPMDQEPADVRVAPGRGR
jgi:tRNA threonylcarbamoyladenosine biosynthesis protein TsaB